MDKLILVDYNGTIVLKDPDIRPYHLIIESIFGRELAKEFKSPNKSRELLKDKKFSREQFLEFFKNFKNSEFYAKLQESGNETILKVLSKCNDLPESNLESFIFDEVIYPLMALYNIHIADVKPFPGISDLFERNATNGFCIVINSDSPHTVLLMELDEYAKMEEYSFLRPLLEEGRVYGNTDTSTKSDKDRVEVIIKDLQTRRILNETLEQIEVIGDADSDIKSFKSLDAIQARPRTNLTLTLENHLMLISKFSQQCEEYKNHKDRLDAISEKLKKIEKEKTDLQKESQADPRRIKIVDKIMNIGL